MKKFRAIATLVLVSFLLVGCTTGGNGDGTTTSSVGVPSPQDQFTLEQDGVKAEFTFLGDRFWEYTLSADLPTPCYQLTAETIIAESFPEQVTVKAMILPLDTGSDVACAQVITPAQYTGSYQADAKATANLTVEKQ